MSPKEKAKELYQKMLEAGDAQGDFVYDASAKASAIIAVDEILKTFEGLDKPEYVSFDSVQPRNYTFDSEYETHMTGYDMEEYYKQVKQEIEKI